MLVYDSVIATISFKGLCSPGSYSHVHSGMLVFSSAGIFNFITLNRLKKVFIKVILLIWLKIERFDDL